MTSIAILGAGAMGSAIGTGLLKSGWDKLSIRYADVNLERVGELVKDGFIAYSDPSIAAESASIVLIAVKPQGMGELLGQIAPVISPEHLGLDCSGGLDSHHRGWPRAGCAGSEMYAQYPRVTWRGSDRACWRCQRFRRGFNPG